tara:strand:+ start:62 stop:412 length:351 start_codon:yes stop_codon:yes gene_type:complete
MEDNDHLIDNVKQWLNIDNEIKTLQKEIKERRKIKKTITASLVDIMKNRDIEIMSTSDGELIRTSRKVKSALSKKHLLQSLSVFFKNDSEIIGKLSNYILESRPEKTLENIRRKIK